MPKNQKAPVQILPLQTFLLNNNPYHYILSDRGEVLLKKGASPESKAIKPKKQVIYPSEQEVIDYFQLKGYTVESAKKAFKHYNDFNWQDSHGKKVINWKQKMSTNWMTEENLEKKEPSATRGFVM
jgi:hypothetical protein